MRKHMIEDAASKVATQVRTVELSIDSTLAELTELQSRMLRIAAIAHVGPAAIHPALKELAGALSSLVAARASIVSCHHELAAARGKVPGLRTVAWGDDGECPPTSAAAVVRMVA